MKLRGYERLADSKHVNMIMLAKPMANARYNHRAPDPLKYCLVGSCRVNQAMRADATHSWRNNIVYTLDTNADLICLVLNKVLDGSPKYTAAV